MSTAPLHIWQPSLRAFGLRSLGIFLVTFLLLTPAWPIVGGLAALVTALCLSVVYMFVLDDFTLWLRHRQAKWTLTAHDLRYENPSDDLETHSMALSDISDARARFLWDVQLRLSDGTAVTMRFVDAPRSVCQIINNAIANQMPPKAMT